MASLGRPAAFVLNGIFRCGKFRRFGGFFRDRGLGLFRNRFVRDCLIFCRDIFRSFFVRSCIGAFAVFGRLTVGLILIGCFFFREFALAGEIFGQNFFAVALVVLIFRIVRDKVGAAKCTAELGYGAVVFVAACLIGSRTKIVYTVR